MKRMTDEEWLQQARASFARNGTWSPAALPELTGAPILSAIPEAAGHEQDALPCPHCAAPMAILVAAPYIPEGMLHVCQQCYGLLVDHAALTGFPAGSETDHPALLAKPAPRNCRSCGGALKPNDVCSRCARPLPERPCPKCRVTMAQKRQDGVTVDACPKCHVVWLDVGEAGQLFKLVPARSLASRMVADQYGEPPEDGSELLTALAILARIFLPFL